MRIVVVDAETSSAVDLKKAGAYRYFADPSTRVLMIGFQDTEDQDAHVWQPHQGAPPAALVAAIEAPSNECLLAGFNMAFDAQALEKLGFTVPVEKQLDLALLAYLLGFSGGLDNVLEQFEIPVRKSTEGRRLIQRFSRGQAPWYEHPTDWDQFLRYCHNDVSVEVALYHKCMQWLGLPDILPMVQSVLNQWQMDQRMNRRGLPISRPLVEGALAVLGSESQRLKRWMAQATGLANPNSIQQLSAWLSRQGYPVDNLQAATVADLLDTLPAESLVYQVLEAHQSLSRASVKKFLSMHLSQVDARLKGSVTTYGASRTGRTASRGVNLANLERPKLRFTDAAAEVLEAGHHDAFATYLRLFEPGVSVIQGLGSCVRGAITAPPGYGITAIDLKSIESVALAWMCNCDAILDLFHHGRDTYKDFATRYYGIPYDAVTKQQRSFCKPAVLGCGYGAGAGALVRYAKGMGVVLEEVTAQEMVVVFRSSFAEIPAYWREADTAAKQAVQTPGRVTYANRVQYQYDGTFLRCTLPSGRMLFYHRPRITMERRRAVRAGEPDWFSESLSYMGKNQDSGGAWQRVYTHGGKLVENIVQAVCRDILYHGLALIDQDPDIELVGSLYDEAITLTRLDDSDAYHRINTYMQSKPAWLDERFFLGADGYHNAKRYRK